ncbi:MAG: hypothetical protein H0U95_06885 [Bacteroidetes bacterium]|nr:hypothetical protein [Bacteroidota bacterium]
MKNKKWLLLLILVLPSTMWLILETSTINSKKLPIYGPRKVLASKDTAYYKVNDQFYALNEKDSSKQELIRLTTDAYPLYVVMFIKDAYKKNDLRLAGLSEYLNYKKQKIEHIPIVLITESENGRSDLQDELKKLAIGNNNVLFYTWNKQSFDSLNNSYFLQKPYYIDYSFFTLVDINRNIRGYYDGRYVAELKRLIDEYQHLRLKEEKNKLIKSNEIKTNT